MKALTGLYVIYLLPLGMRSIRCNAKITNATSQKNNGRIAKFKGLKALNNPMARSRSSPNKSQRPKGILQTTPVKRRESNPNELLSQALTLLHIGDAESALPLALRALALSNPNQNNAASATVHQQVPPAFLQALSLLAEINLELGDADAARSYFLKAVTLDPQGEISEEEGGGVEKFLWLAQLSEEGGEESVRWFQRGAEILRREIAALEAAGMKRDGAVEKKRKLVEVLCGIVEVYMTDLS